MDYCPVIMVTGCSSGLGLAIAKQLAKKTEYRIVLTARKKSLYILQEKIQESDRIVILPLDITNPEQRDQVINKIETIWGVVDILINNAGISYRSVAEHMSYEDELNQMTTNYFAQMALIRRVIPLMRKRGRGKIINISSVSGMLAMPTMSSYSASKYALEGASEALWYELRPFGINVSLIQPGFIRSNSFQNVCISDKARHAIEHKEDYYDYYNNMGPFITRLMNMSRSTPEKIAKKIMFVIKKESPPLWIAATPDAYLFALIRRILPRRILLPVLFLFLPKSRDWGKEHTKKRKFFSVGYLRRLLGLQ